MKTRGFTLIEILITMGLIAMALLSLARLVQAWSEFRRFEAGRADLRRARQALLQMQTEAQEATQWLQPAPASLAVFSQMEFRKPDPAAEGTRLPDPLPWPLPGTWDANDPAALLRVRYDVDGLAQHLRREVRDASNRVEQMQVAHSIAGFACRFHSDGTLTIEFSLFRNGKLELVSSRCWLPGRIR